MLLILHLSKQVFKFISVVVRVISGEMFSFNLDRVLITEDEVRGALLCAQDFVWSLHFTLGNFFSDSVVAMLSLPPYVTASQPAPSVNPEGTCRLRRALKCLPKCVQV